MGLNIIRRNNMENILDRILINKEQIDKRVTEIAGALTEEYKNAEKPPLMVCILRGGCVFFVDLIKKMNCNVEMEFMSVSSYGNGFESTGKVTIKKDADTDITGRDVVIVEDIIDSGWTMKNLTELLQKRNPKSLKIVALLDKASRRQVEVKIDWTGFVIPDEFIVGYGLDYMGLYRNIPEIGVLKPELYR